jgi:flagellar hook-length control protein FliK
MKTSGVSQQPSPPPTSTSKSSASTKSSTSTKSSEKADSKPQKEFKEVLDSDKPSLARGKAQFGKHPQRGIKPDKLEKEHPDNQPATSAGRKPISAKSGKEDSQKDFLKKEDAPKKLPKEKEDLKEFSVPTHMMMGPAPVHAKAEVQKTHGPALNIKEIESIVQKVQVGINEKGLPEMNFELQTDKLGALNLKVSTENDKINIQFVTQDTAAQAELQKGLTELSQLLGQRGLNLAETNVMTRDQQNQQQQQQGRERGESESGPAEGVQGSRARKKVITGPSDDGFTI